ncbi:CHAT domain-containing protein [Streptomyces sp. NPDC006458]|uniref:CHAT domain-containing protein n=1 Tax=Streptomyces sp. NPDC006458 TaxID=3154302 RepID=UPI0033B1615C
MPSDPLFSMEARLRRFRAEGDPEVLLGPEARDEARTLTEALAAGPGLAHHLTLGSYHWCRSSLVSARQAQREAQLAADLLLPCYVAGLPGLPEELVPALAGTVLRAATDDCAGTLSTPEGVPSPPLLDLWRRALRDAPAALRDEVLTGFLPFSGSFSFTPEQTDCLLELARAVLDVTPTGHPDRAVRLLTLARTQVIRFAHSDTEADLDACREACRAAQQIVPADHALAAELTVLWRNTERLRLRRTVRPAELDEAVASARRALAAAPSAADRRERQCALAAALHARFRAAGSLTDLREAADAYEELVRQAPADDSVALRLDETVALADVLAELPQRSRLLSDLDRVVGTLRLLVDDDAVALPLRVLALTNLVTALTTRFGRTGLGADLDAAVESLDAFARELPADAPDTAEVTLLHGRALELRAQRLEQPADLDAAVLRFRQAAETPSPDETVRLNAWGHLGSGLRERGQATQSRGDLDASVEVCRRAVDATPSGHPLSTSLRTNLAASHNARHRLTGNLTDVDAEIAINEELIVDSGAEDPEHSLHVFRLGLALHLRFRATEQQADLDRAVDTLRTALELAPPGSPQAATAQQALRAAYAERYKVTKQWGDLEAAATAAQGNSAPPAFPDVPADGHLAYFDNGDWVTRLPGPGWNDGLMPLVLKLREHLDTVPASSPQWPYVKHLKALLDRPPQEFGGVAGLRRAVDEYGAALEPIPIPITDSGGIDYDGYLAALRDELRDPAERPYGEIRVQTVVDVQALALAEREPVGPQYTYMVLACALLARHERSGDPRELSAAVSAARSAVEAGRPGAPERAAQYCFLADALRIRHERTGERDDLMASVAALYDLARLLPPGGTPRGRLHFNLARAHRLAFERWGDAQDEAAAVRELGHARSAVADDHPDHRLYTAVGVRWARDDADALDELVGAFRAVLAALPEDDPDRAPCRSSLAELLAVRHRRAGDRESLDAAVDAGRLAVAAVSVPGAALAADLVRTAELLRLRHELAGDPADRAFAIDALTRAATVVTASPALRIDAARAAADLLAPDDPRAAARELTAAVRLLPEAAPRQRSRAARQDALAAFPGLVGDAVALTLATGAGAAPAAEALGLLESGRAVLLNQALDLRGDVPLLRQHHPGLAGRLENLRGALGRRETDPVEGPPSARSPHHQGHLSEELADLLEGIRQTPGFSSFAQPPSPRALVAEAAEGPVVVFNLSAHRSDALIVTPGGVEALPLPALTPAAVQERARDFHRALGRATAPRVALQQRAEAQESLLGHLAWLWDHATGPVLDRLGFGSAHTGNAPWPRVWWIPGGLLGRLPLHAAGHHDDPPRAPDRRTVLDRVVSSYSPSVRALRFSRERRRSLRGPADRALIVSMPTTPGLHAPLTSAAREAELLRRRLPGSLLLRPPQPGSGEEDLATSSRVMARLADFPIVHFACHALCHPTDPSQSTLLLADHATAPMTVQRLNTLSLERGQLAYLSACSTTATTARTLLDEALHLTSAFQLAGFPHVIGTLWPVTDTGALTVADTFYDRLGTDGPIGDAALALHEATRTLRDRYPRLVSAWAAHLHTGA